MLENLLVITQYEVRIDFTTYSTFMISDDDTIFENYSTSQLTIYQIVTNMEDLGCQGVNARRNLAFQVAYFENVDVIV